MKKLIQKLRASLGMAALLALVITNCTNAAYPDDKAVNEVRSYLESVMELGEIPGLSVSVYFHGRPLLDEGYGYANLEWQQYATPDTVYEIGSITKSFTAMAIAILVEEGKLSLHDTLGMYVQEIPRELRDVTIRSMLTHTSGLGSFNFNPDYRKQLVGRDIEPEKVLSYLSSNAQKMFEPGDELFYSNDAVWFLGLIIERLSGLSYGDYLQEMIFRPLGLGDTVFNSFETIVNNRADGYQVSEDGSIRNVLGEAPAISFSAGGILSTTRDLQRYMYALHKGDKVGRRVREIMLGAGELNDGRSTFYTTGLLIHGDFHGHKKFEHAGTIEGFSAQHAYYPDDDLGIVVLSNSMFTSNPVNFIEAQIARILLGVVRVDQKWEIKVDRFEDYIGEYELSESVDYFGAFKIFKDEGKLVFELLGTAVEEVVPILPLYLLGEDRIGADWLRLFSYSLDIGRGESEGVLLVNGLSYKVKRTQDSRMSMKNQSPSDSE